MLVLLGIGGLSGALVLIVNLRSKQSAPIVISPLTELKPRLVPGPTVPKPAPTPTASPHPQPSPPKTSEFKLELTAYLATRAGDWAINLTEPTNTILSIQGGSLFPAASVMKLVTALTAIDQIQTGNLSAETMVEDRSITAWMQALVNRSDNYAWDVLRDNVGYDQEVRFLKRNHINNIDLSQNTISANAANQILQIIWRQHQNQVLPDLAPLMVDTETEARIPQGAAEFFDLLNQPAPSIYHKAGTWPPTGSYNDAAIIPLEDNVWFLSILSQGDQTQDQAEETIRGLTKRILGAII